MKISDINRELYKDDIIRIEKELDYICKEIKRQIIKRNNRINIDVREEYLYLNVGRVYYPDGIKIDNPEDLYTTHSINDFIEKIATELSKKYNTEIKYNKIRIYPIIPAKIWANITCVLVMIMITLYIVFHPNPIFIEIISVAICTFLIMHNIYCAYMVIYKRWLS